jgi:HSP20 family protein
MMPSTRESMKEKEPIVDVFEEGDCFQVMAELPGIEEKAIKLEVKANTLTISTDASARAYFKEVELPSLVEKKVVESRYRNDILEVKLRKMKKGS